MSVYFERYKDVVDDWSAFMEAVKRPLPTTIWANPLKITPEELEQRLKQAGIHPEPIDWIEGGFRLPDVKQPGLLWEYMAGLFHVQEEVSMLPIKLLDVQPHHTVLDMCAAPGNKTAQIAIEMQNKGTVIANDRSVNRLKASRQIFNRLGLVNITMFSHDASNLPSSVGQFDRILADVPCTCEGTCRKTPSVMSRASANGAVKMSRVQKAILRKAIQLCKPGGKVLYSTCTFAPEENEMVLQEMIDLMPDYVRIVPTQVDGFVTSSGLSEWNGRKFHHSMQNAIRVWPHQNDTGGFFMALIEKQTGNNPTPPLAELNNSQSTIADAANIQFEREPWLTELCERFGFQPELFAEYDILRVGKRGTHFVNQDHLVINKPKPDSVGMLFMRTDGRFPKLTTAAGMIFGKYATQNKIEINSEQAMAYFTRQTFPVTDEQITNCTGTGYVILNYQETAVGIGTFHVKSQSVESSFPKGWVRKNVIV